MSGPSKRDIKVFTTWRMFLVQSVTSLSMRFFRLRLFDSMFTLIFAHINGMTETSDKVS